MVGGLRLREWLARPRTGVSRSGQLGTQAPRCVTIADRSGLGGPNTQVVLSLGDTSNAPCEVRDCRKSLRRRDLLRIPDPPRWRVRLIWRLDSRFATSNLLSLHGLGDRVSSDAP